MRTVSDSPYKLLVVIKIEKKTVGAAICRPHNLSLRGQFKLPRI